MDLILSNKLNDYIKKSYFQTFLFLLSFSVILYGLFWLIELGNMAYIKSLPIKLELSFLPGYTLLSLTRSLIALCISFCFSITYGTLAAHKKLYEKIMIPALDVLQSLPLLSFLPVFINNIVPLSPNNRWGIEISCILNIFIGQVWGLIFAYYESQKTLPSNLKDFIKVSHINPVRRFF